ncbi:unnamed protein product [Cuscuta epithymum]|uniref:Uncharacterized protein n=1 Tax=Cuscuta epithymum TaxID=186058 RepID=A0AAV0C4T0_9ASTE|nr:unnamed protein product [Cuscuta epithymum]
MQPPSPPPHFHSRDEEHSSRQMNLNYLQIVKSAISDEKSSLDSHLGHATPCKAKSVPYLKYPQLFRVHFGDTSLEETDPYRKIRKRCGENLVNDTYEGLDGMEEEGEEVDSPTWMVKAPTADEGETESDGDSKEVPR